MNEDVCMCCGCINGEHFNCTEDLYSKLAAMTAETDGLKAELEEHHKSLKGQIEIDRDAWKERFHTADNQAIVWKSRAERMEKALDEYGDHRRVCIRTFWEAGEATPDGGYRTKYKGRWYQSKPVNEEPKCNCGFDEALDDGKGVA